MGGEPSPTVGAGSSEVLIEASVFERAPFGTKQSRESVAGPVSELWSTRGYRVIFIYILSCLGLTVLLPFISTLQTDFFAKKRAGESIECVGLAPGVKPPTACLEAHSDVLTWKSWAAFIQNAVLAVYFNPAVGTWSDLYGRQFFIILGLLLNMLPPLAILLYLKNIIELYWFWPASVISQALGPFTVSIAYLGDIVSKENRTVVFGFFAGTFYISSILGSTLNITGLVTDSLTATVVSLVMSALTALLAIFWLPESLPRDFMVAARKKAVETGVVGGRGLWAAVRKPFLSASESLRILLRNGLFIKLTMTVMLVMLVFEESIELMFQYLQEVAGFDTIDQSISFALLGFGGLFSLYFLLWFLYTVLGISEKWVLIIGICSWALEQLSMIFVEAKWQAFVAIGLSTAGGLVFPAIQAIKSKMVGEQEQGAVQGALVGAKSFAMGVGPFLFLLFFKAFRNHRMYFPGAPFVATSVLEIIALVLACTIKLPTSFLEVQKSSQKSYLGRASISTVDERQEKLPLLQEV